MNTDGKSWSLGYIHGHQRCYLQQIENQKLHLLVQDPLDIRTWLIRKVMNRCHLCLLTFDINHPYYSICHNCPWIHHALKAVGKNPININFDQPDVRILPMTNHFWPGHVHWTCSKCDLGSYPQSTGGAAIFFWSEKKINWNVTIQGFIWGGLDMFKYMYMYRWKNAFFDCKWCD